MKKKWYEKRTPEEQEAVRQFNASIRNDAYGDYYLGGDEYIAPKSAKQLQADKEWENKQALARRLGMELPAGFAPKSSNRNEYDPYKSYKSGGAWRGYQAYKPALLDYRYIEQMANALASKHNVKIKVGDTWCIDLDKKELTYNPMTLMTGSKSRMIAGLLHEIGHLRHTTPVSQMKTPQEYGNTGHEILNLYEDFRIDEIMSSAYSGAGSVYEANIPVIQSIAEGYGEKEKKYRGAVVEYLQKYVEQLKITHKTSGSYSYGYTYADGLKRNKALLADEKKNHRLAKAAKPKNPTEKRLRINAMSMATRRINTSKREMARLGQAFDTIYDELMLKGKDRTRLKALKRVENAIELAKKGETLLGYESLILCEAYGVIPQGIISQGMRARVDKTKGAIEKARNAKSTQAVVDICNTDVYPHIRELLLNFHNGENLESSVGKKVAKEASEYAKHESGKSGEPESRQNQTKEGSGQGKEIPQEWANGDYNALKASVQTAINELVQRLRFIRASDNANRYETNIKRGKLHGKHLYRLSLGSDRLFRKKTEQKDRVGQVGLSVIIDKSGSMYNGNMVHTIRGAIILAEACSQLDIPLEIMTFSGRSNTIKKHDDEYTPQIQGTLAGIVNAQGGSSNLYTSLQETQINKLQKRNKVCVILSDGGVGGSNSYKQYFDEMRKNNVLPVGIGVQCGDEIVRLVGEGESTNNAYELPAIFERVMKQCINRIIKT